MDRNQLLSLLEEEKVFYVIRNKNYEVAENVCEALIENGAKVLELTFTIPNADKLVKKLSEKYPDHIFGVGTVLNISCAIKAKEAGAKFLVGPVFDYEVNKYCIENNLFYVPGAMTLQDVQQIKAAGDWKVVKIFPANTFGLNFIKTIKTFYTDTKFMASGGIDNNNFVDALTAGYDFVALGSSLTGGVNDTVVDKDKIKNDMKKIFERKGK